MGNRSGGTFTVQWKRYKNHVSFNVFQISALVLKHVNTTNQVIQDSRAKLSHILYSLRNKYYDIESEIFFHKLSKDIKKANNFLKSNDNLNLTKIDKGNISILTTKESYSTKWVTSFQNLYHHFQQKYNTKNTRKQ